jgi:NADH-quinone oxidoreductase subunit M
MTFFFINLLLIFSAIYFSFSNFLFCIIILPLIGVFVIIPQDKENSKKTALLITVSTFILSLFLWVFFDNSTDNFQFINRFLWVPSINLNFLIGIDGISLFFILLTTFLIPLCLLSSWDSVQKNIKEYLIIFLIIETFLIIIFSVLDLFLFYVFFESILIPMFLLIIL